MTFISTTFLQFLPKLSTWTKKEGSRSTCKVKNSDLRTNFFLIFISNVAVAIGNGLIDPLIQFKSFGPYLYANNLISQSALNSIQQQYVQCAQDLEAGDYSDAFNDCSQVAELAIQSAGNINVYDIRQQCAKPPLCYDMSNIENYLAQPSVLKKLGISSSSAWTSCNSAVYGGLMYDVFHSYRFDIPKLLANDIRVLLYNGKLQNTIIVFIEHQLQNFNLFADVPKFCLILSWFDR